MILNYWPRRLRGLVATVAFVGGVILVAAMQQVRLQPNAQWTGWLLIGLFTALMSFSLRKRLSSLPIGMAATWMQWHVWMGFAAIGIFHVHVGWRLPVGGFSWVLWLLFWAVSITGIIGLILSRFLPPLLRTVGNEVIWERIPEEVVELHDEAAGIVQNNLAKSEGMVLAGFFFDRIGPWLRRPRFMWLGEGEQRIQRHFINLSRLVGDDLREAVEDLEVISREKMLLDRHYFVQGILKGWLFVHIPCATAAYAAAICHAAIELWFRS